MSDGFDPYADRYEALVAESIRFSGQNQGFFLEARARRLLDVASRSVGSPASLRALDVGAGLGLMDRHLGAFGTVEGVDLSQRMVEEAARRNPDVAYHLADGAGLPFEDGSFDVAFTSCVLHHVAPRDRGAFVAEMRRVTRRGGIVVVFEHNPLNPLTRLAVARCEFDEDAILLRRRETLDRLRGAGLAPVESRYILFFPWRGRLFARAERLLAPAPLGAQYYVAARV